MTEQITEFDRWFEQFMDPELNLTPGDKELCRHAWQAALSHAEGEAVAYQYRRKNQFTGEWSDWVPCDPERARYLRAGDDPDAGLYEVRELVARGAAPQVAVPEGWKLVPVEPTLAMMVAFEGWREYDIADHWGDAARRPYGSWRAMLAAAPTEQPVSDPDGLNKMRRLFVEITNGEAMSDPDTGEVSGYFIANEQMDRWDQFMDSLSTPAPDEREIAARALGEQLERFNAQIDKVGNPPEAYSYPGGQIDGLRFAASCLVTEIERLRAGKGDE